MNQFSLADLQAFVRALYPENRVTMVPYGYTVSFTALTQGSAQTASLNITGNADFVLTGMSYRANIGAAQNIGNKTAAFARLLITDSGSNEQFFNSASDLENICSNGNSKGGSLAYPRFIAGRTALIFQLTSYAPTAETYAIDIFLSGMLVRAYTGQ